MRDGAGDGFGVFTVDVEHDGRLAGMPPRIPSLVSSNLGWCQVRIRAVGRVSPREAIPEGGGECDPHVL